MIQAKGSAFRLLFAGKIAGGKTYQISLQVADLSNGLYFVRLATKDENIYEKLSLLK